MTPPTTLPRSLRVTKRTEQQRRKEFEEEALVHLDLLYNSAVQMTRNVADAQDLIQETFLKAYRFFDKFKRGTNCKAWLFKIMKNNYINAFRKRAKEPAKVDFEDVEATLEAPPQPLVGTGDEREMKDVFEELVEDDVKAALDELPFEFKMAVILSDIEGFTYQEIAEIMECPIGTVRSRLSRARRFLQGKLYEFAKKRGIVKSQQ